MFFLYNIFMDMYSFRAHYRWEKRKTQYLIYEY